MELILPAKMHGIRIEVKVDEANGKVSLIFEPQKKPAKPDEVFEMNYMPPGQEE